MQMKKETKPDLSKGKTEILQKIIDLPAFQEHKLSVERLLLAISQLGNCSECGHPLEVTGAMVYAPDRIYIFTEAGKDFTYTKEEWGVIGDSLGFIPLQIDEGFHFLLHVGCYNCKAHEVLIVTDSSNPALLKSLEEQFDKTYQAVEAREIQK